MRLRLEQAGYSREVVHPPLRENFAATCEAAMLQDGLPLLSRWLPGSILTLQGLLDPAVLSAECATVATTGHGAGELYRPLALEAALQLPGHTGVGADIVKQVQPGRPDRDRVRQLP